MIVLQLLEHRVTSICESLLEPLTSFKFVVSIQEMRKMPKSKVGLGWSHHGSTTRHTPVKVLRVVS